MTKLATVQQFSQTIALKNTARSSFVLSVWIMVQRDYLCDLGTAMSKAADRLWFRSQTLSRFSENPGVLLGKLCCYVIREVVQDADAVLCGLHIRYMQKHNITYKVFMRANH